ncbi:hypothetical protein [Pseudonocardia asaccharolytica]|uniref:Uncharacterized protein n=1 Tax=Pseudonocardia asaccharolytica DSM 44247 = NBRC 16224 TaxID=1123024 RepID=A0A511D783_9PSEU|nr:hypothetical protein [Pseudonocardia asaccharolytica]GEL20660.1 hypothetical protein PA7_44970 [Pseudonocardia asaccharolytica DSM 44247 = NBRC 16224]
MLKVLGILLLIWIAISVIGAMFKFLAWAVVIGALAFAGVAVWSAVTGRSDRKSLR